MDTSHLQTEDLYPTLALPHLREVSALTIENTKAATDTTLKMNKIVSLY